jgi:hypothetical protein
MSDDAFEVAEGEARTILEAAGTTAGATDEPATGHDNAIVMLRINGVQKARQCGHLSGPSVVYLHSAIGVHQCSTCASSPETRRRIDEHRPSTCDSCGEASATLWETEFKVTNILVHAYVCDGCRQGRRHATLPPGFQNLGTPGDDSH